MLTKDIQSAMQLAKYDLLPDGTYFGEIPGLTGVFANSASLEECRDQLQEVLEGWIGLGLRLRHTMPEVNGLRLIFPRK